MGHLSADAAKLRRQAAWDLRRQRYGASGWKNGARVEGNLQRCRSCDAVKQLCEFWATSAGGIQTECKPCMRQRNNAWYRANADRVWPVIRDRTNKRRRKNFEQFFLTSVRARAKKNGLEFTLTPSDIVIPERCPILGIKLMRNTGWNRGHGLKVRDRSPSIDRIDNTKGYTPDNIVIVSYRANRIKSDATCEELRRLVEFYEDITRRRPALAWAGRMRPADIHGDKSIQVPRVQPPKKEEDRQMSFGEV